ncbi:protease SohB [Ectothiorhodospiraceae bacterium 2226]|nr:protease SohB [Ectothiorhodospiraceae bacterium 2226]
MDLLGDYALFLAKTVTIVLALVALAALLGGRGRHKHAPEGRLQVHHLNARYDAMARALERGMEPARSYRHWLARPRKRPPPPAGPRKGRPRMFVLNFTGDVRASAVASLREEISAILGAAREGDRVLLRLQSPGGVVHGYGLAASQLLRLKAKGLPLTVAVDKVAASGGYMMACVADRIVAAPFAVVGSIGVIAQLPNFNRLLKAHNIDFEQFKGGEYKRTVTLFGENTEAEREKFQGDIDTTHRLFKDFVAQHRPGLDIGRVSTGEYWYGTEALQLGLIDEIGTSDDLLLQAASEAELFEVSYARRQPLTARLFGAIQALRQPWS